MRIHCSIRGTFIALIITAPATRASEGFVGSRAEYVLVGTTIAATAALEHWPPNRSRPLLGGEQKPYIARERVPDWALAGGWFATGGVIRFGPGPHEARVRHAHGFIMASSANALATALAKGIVGRKRPNEDARRALGEKPRSRAFWSGHASASFLMATYGTLWTWDRTDAPLARATIPVALYGAATYAAWSRVAEHRHYPSDVIAGAAAGTTIAALVFRRYDRMAPDRESPVAIVPSPGGIALTVRF